MTRPTPDAEGDALRVFVGGDRLERTAEQFARDVEYAHKSETHLWVINAAFAMTDRAAKAVATGDPEYTPSLDSENLRVITTGCLVCEQALDARLVGRRCPGEPS